MKFSLILFFLLTLIISACTDRDVVLDKLVEAYYKVYNERQDDQKILSFYDENIILEDIINGDRLVGRQAVGDFFDWGNPNFIRLDSNILVIEEKVIQNDRAVIKGYFSRFQWGSSEFGPMYFTTILTFNKSKKIIHQIDWINYPSTLVNYNNRKDSNAWIK